MWLETVIKFQVCFVLILDLLCYNIGALWTGIF